ncbi:MAG TPA: TonB-dependent receptor [Flavobacterium sp.]|nr:TonB-dependent receptor [Flavobacterium sp.]
MTAKKLLVFWMLLLCQFIFAQQDSIALKEVTVSDVQLKKFSNTQSVIRLSDSIIEKNQPSLTSLLNYNSTIYFKENGLGMVSSPSFRGTTAQQTAVIWNGININSQLLGQTDFNTITTMDFDEIDVRAGGGSAIYGSSAIGGSIHLNNDLNFKDQFRNELQVSYGSFNTFGANYKMAVSNEKVSVNVGVSRNSSENDYEYLDTKNKHNENGQFYNTSLNADFGYRFNRSNFLKFYSQVFEGERHFSGTLSAPSKSKYQDLNSRNLIEWDYFSGGWSSKTKVAFLNEQYKYFENFKLNNFETSKAETFIAKYDLAYNFNNKMSLNAVLDYTKVKGIGSEIGVNIREMTSAVLLFRHQVLEKLGYELSVRKEFNDDYESPVLFAFGTKIQPFKIYSIKVNVSRNFRIPTFNDLYWQGSGNPDLKPESSLQGELGQEIKVGSFSLAATAYYMEIKDLIRWTPVLGIWTPENVGEVKSYGAEAVFGFNRKFGNHQIRLNATYGYTVSEDQKLEKQLVYVPYHKSASNLEYSWRKFTFSYQHLYNGSVYILNDHSDKLEEYQVSNVGIDYDFGQKNTWRIGFRALNIWNENYQSVSKRPLPGSNYVMNLTLKF